jgi:hypothetical protein
MCHSLWPWIHTYVRGGKAQQSSRPFEAILMDLPVKMHGSRQNCKQGHRESRLSQLSGDASYAQKKLCIHMVACNTSLQAGRDLRG